MTPARPLLRYHGGKWRLAPWIIGHFPRHLMYVEPFGGGASVLLRKAPARQEVYNDLDGEIVNLFRVLRDLDQAERLTGLLSLTPHARAEYDLSCEEPVSCPVETARRTLVRAYMGYGSNAVTGQYKSGFRNKLSIGETGLAVNWMDYPSAIPAFVRRLRHVTIECLDALECIPRYDARETLFYVDPPYLPETRTAHGESYRHEMTPEQHHQLAGILHAVEGMVILSGYDSPLYRELYANWRVTTRNTIDEKAAKRTECLWISPNASAAMPHATNPSGVCMNQIALMSPEDIQALVDQTTERALAAVREKTPGKKLLSQKEVEKEYGISARNLERWRYDGVGPQYTTIGRRIFYERVVLDAYIVDGRVKTTGRAD